MIWFLRVALIDSFIFNITDVTKNLKSRFKRRVSAVLTWLNYRTTGF